MTTLSHWPPLLSSLPFQWLDRMHTLPRSLTCNIKFVSPLFTLGCLAMYVHPASTTDQVQAGRRLPVDTSEGKRKSNRSHFWLHAHQTKLWFDRKVGTEYYALLEGFNRIRKAVLKIPFKCYETDLTLAHLVKTVGDPRILIETCPSNDIELIYKKSFSLTLPPTVQCDIPNFIL
jgi:hypothetical protein